MPKLEVNVKYQYEEVEINKLLEIKVRKLSSSLNIQVLAATGNLYPSHLKMRFSSCHFVS
jgi:hypothetical protein